MAVSEKTYLRLVQDDPNSGWELHCGQLRSKQPMTWDCSDLYGYLGFLIQLQLDRSQFVVKWNAGHVRRSEDRYYVPDLVVVSRAMAQRSFPEPGIVEVCPEPLPLIVEVWSPSTGRVNFRDKLPAYQQRGDAEICLAHPYDKTLTAWVRQPDGAYAETVYRGGVIRPAALPNVSIDLDQLFNA
jgi:Uma2 family endonuclease